MNPELLYQVALTMVPNIGPVQAKVLTERFGTAENIFNAKRKSLGSADNIGDVRAKSIKEFSDFAAAEEEIKFIEKFKIRPLFLTDTDYPKRLLNCYDCPVLLYYKGNADLNASKVISIIGTRNYTAQGRDLTEKLVEGLKTYNVIICSGLAYGIDAIAHRAALQNDLHTVGVLAHGLQTVYPGQHKNLAKEICAHGGLLTEFSSKAKPDKHNFPKRNRIVAGMADATIVMETAIKGGSMITAELANNYNRDVFAYPGRATDIKSEGCNFLIKNNRAALITCAGDLIEQMGWQERKSAKPVQRQLFIELSADEKQIVDMLQTKGAMHIDDINFSSRMSSSAVAAAILSLELQSVIIALPGKMYAIN